ncbi:MAG: hypothetical protein ACYS32_19285, partial [Planctomycetota bacterium]
GRGTHGTSTHHEKLPIISRRPASFNPLNQYRTLTAGWSHKNPAASSKLKVYVSGWNLHKVHI